MVLALAVVVSADQPAPTRVTGPFDAHFLQMHDRFLARGRAGPIGILFLGDSITEWWTKAPDVWQQHYGALRPANFGVAGNRIQHVLWQVDHGELDGIHPPVVVLLIGTNNHTDTVEQIAGGIGMVVARVHAKLPDTKLLLLGIFPRGRDPSKPTVVAVRDKIRRVNAELARLDDGRRTRYLDVGDRFLSADGTISEDVMRDTLHPSAKGYQIWADAMQPLLDEMMKG
jgi:lysophospholipase L1-like esterase